MVDGVHLNTNSSKINT